MKRVLLGSCLLLIASTARADFGVDQFLRLDAGEQDRILVASYDTAAVLLFFGGIGMGDGKMPPEKMTACLKDREVIWLRKTFAEYVKKHPHMGINFGANFAQSLAWKCGILKFMDEQ